MTNSSQKPFILPKPIYKCDTEQYTIVVSKDLEEGLLRGDPEAMHEGTKLMKKYARHCNRPGITERWKLRTKLRLERDLKEATETQSQIKYTTGKRKM